MTSTTRVDGRLALRPCFVNPRTTLADADALVDEVLTVGRELAAGEPARAQGSSDASSVNTGTALANDAAIVSGRAGENTSSSARRREKITSLSLSSSAWGWSLA